MARPDFAALDIYRLSEDLIDSEWDIVVNPQVFSRRSVGEQLVRSADPISASIAESPGRENRR